MNGLMDRAFELSGYHAKRKRFAAENSDSRCVIKKGIGFASFLARRGIHRIGRGISGIGSGDGGDWRKGTCASWPPARRWGRARIRFLRRLRPRRCGSIATQVEIDAAGHRVCAE